jgi:hypothetical protein
MQTLNVDTYSCHLSLCSGAVRRTPESVPRPWSSASVGLTQPPTSPSQNLGWALFLISLFSHKHSRMWLSLKHISTSFYLDTQLLSASSYLRLKSVKHGTFGAHVVWCLLSADGILVSCSTEREQLAPEQHSWFANTSTIHLWSWEFSTNEWRPGEVWGCHIAVYRVDRPTFDFRLNLTRVSPAGWIQG